MEKPSPGPLPARQALLKIHTLIETEKAERASAAVFVRWVLAAIVLLIAVVLISAWLSGRNAPEKRCLLDGQLIACKNNPFADKPQKPEVQPQPNTQPIPATPRAS